MASILEWDNKGESRRHMLDNKTYSVVDHKSISNLGLAFASLGAMLRNIRNQSEGRIELMEGRNCKVESEKESDPNPEERTVTPIFN